MGKIILDLCGGTGSWSRPYKEAGYDVKIITLPDYDVTKVVFSDDYMVFNKQTYVVNDLAVKYTDVHGVLSAPPCTEFSLAKGAAPRDFDNALRAVDACMKIIWACRKHGKLKFWALENPVGYLRQFLGIPAFQFEQWQYGETTVKRTDIWGYFRQPKPIVLEKPRHTTTNIGKRVHGREWSKISVPEEYSWLNELPYDQKRAALRAITPPGFARAFFKANP